MLVQVGFVLSLLLMDSLFFGGNEYSLIALNISEKRLLEGKIKSPFELTYSLEVCESTKSKVYLSMGGWKPKFSSYVYSCAMSRDCVP